MAKVKEDFFLFTILHSNIIEHRRAKVIECYTLRRISFQALKCFVFLNYIGGGFELINQCLQRDGITGKEIAALLNVCANCASVLNDVTLEPLLSSCINAAFEHLKRLGEEELKTKEATSFSELIGALKVRSSYYFSLCFLKRPQNSK
jgi:hypothetical protein